MNSLEGAKLAIEALNQLAIPYMVVGSLSSNYYAIPRATHDADFVIETDEKIKELRAKLAPAFAAEDQIGFETMLMTTKYLFVQRSSAFKLEVFVLSDDRSTSRGFSGVWSGNTPGSAYSSRPPRTLSSRRFGGGGGRIWATSATSSTSPATPSTGPTSAPGPTATAPRNGSTASDPGPPAPKGDPGPSLTPLPSLLDYLSGPFRGPTLRLRQNDVHG